MSDPITTYVDRALEELRADEGAVTSILRGFLTQGVYLTLKPEWDMEDNFSVTEGLASDFNNFADHPTQAERVAMARRWELTPYTDVEGESRELDDEDETP